MKASSRGDDNALRSTPPASKFLMIAFLKFALLLGATLAPKALSSPLEDAFMCGTSISDDRAQEVQANFQNVSAANLDAATIQVVWHVISADNTPQGGNIPDQLIQQQISVLNQDYARAQSGLSFQLVGIDRTLNAGWSNNGVGDGTPAEAQMKQALRKGTVATLNVYSVLKIAGAPPGYLLDGFATFPWDFQSNPWKDGIVLATYAMPGGPIPARGQGRTLTHETGHWVGLYHTFQGGCTAPGDYVDDTPFEASPASGCPQGRDTCPQPGLDPITNYMDYTDDACRTGITPGQVARLTQALRQFRGL